MFVDMKSERWLEWVVNRGLDSKVEWYFISVVFLHINPRGELRKVRKRCEVSQFSQLKESKGPSSLKDMS